MGPADEKTYVIRAGPLNSLASLIYFLSKSLAELSQRYARGMAVQPVFDLTAVEPRRQNMAALTALLSIAERLGKFTGQPIPVRLDWNPAVLGFWDDIKFLEIAQSSSYLLFPEKLIGGYEGGSTNPSTRIMRYELDPDDPIPDAGSAAALRSWKDRNRLRLSNDLSFMCKNIFRPVGSRHAIDERLKELIAATAAELALNSLMHGRVAAYVGVQRTHTSITVAVCDCGDGFPKSLSRHPAYSNAVKRRSPTDTQGLVFACLMNKGEMGLRRAITEITQPHELFDGSVLMSSYNAELQWRHDLWTRTLNALSDLSADPARLDTVALLGPPVEGKPDYEARQQGLHRLWKPGLRGTRIAFEMRLHTDHA